MIRKFEPTPVVKPARHDKPEMTLDRALSRAGVASRTAAAALIAAGRVQVAGRLVRDPQAWVAPARQAILLDGKRLRQPRPEYYALHKPMGYITSHGDPQGRPTIYDLLPADEGWLFSVGRLDQDTSGLLLVTNDSVFAERVANPRSHVAKTYHVRLEAALAEAELGQLQSGLDIGRGERSGPARAARRAGPAGEQWIELEIHEGKNRQVRRMVEALGHQVLALVRVRIGKLELGRLASGKLRAISPGDVV
ncbi:MAG TPA: pseudouridine synthase [Terriglobales bacterium]|nr:pseudouridine synthase [Terriglobales bacterium]